MLPNDANKVRYDENSDLATEFGKLKAINDLNKSDSKGMEKMKILLKCVQEKVEVKK